MSWNGDWLCSGFSKGGVTASSGWAIHCVSHSFQYFSNFIKSEILIKRLYSLQ